MNQDKPPLESPEPEIEEMLAFQREYQKRRVTALGTASLAAVIGGGGAIWAALFLDPPQNPSVVDSVMRDLVATAGALAVIVGLALLGVTIYMTTRLRQGKGP